METLGTILVHLDGGRHVADRLDMARAIAARHDAFLTSLCAVNPLPHDLAVLHRQRAKNQFDRLSARGGWPMRWEPHTDEQAVPALIERALLADLLVMGQHDPEDENTSTLPRDFVEAVVLGSGTPTLIAPLQGRIAERFDTVAIAWKPTRESARAVGAALPLLRLANEVHLVTWMDDADEARRSQQALAEHLQRHRIGRPELHIGAPPKDAGDSLLAFAAGVGADLLVMGCYGHSPARELVLGGATRTVLREMRLPVLMAH